MPQEKRQITDLLRSLPYRMITRVTLTVEGTPTDFVVDTGAEFLVLTVQMAKLRNNKTVVTPLRKVLEGTRLERYL